MTHATSLKLQCLDEKLSTATTTVSNRMSLYNSGLLITRGGGQEVQGRAMGWRGGGGDCEKPST